MYFYGKMKFELVKNWSATLGRIQIPFYLKDRRGSSVEKREIGVETLSQQT